jgi:hypothetical protein
MKRLHFTSPLDFRTAPLTGWTRRHWEEAFFALMKGIVDSASPGGARQVIPGQRSHHGQLADELEGFTRSMWMAGPWLHGSEDGVFTHEGEAVDVGAFYRRGILAGTDPEGEEYWGDITDYAQHLVEMAALAWFLYLTQPLVWERFTPEEQAQVAAYMFQCTQVAYHHNNWLLFNVVTNAALKRLGMPYSQEQIDANLQACEHMYIGEGWYRDGDVNRIDYYNAWAFHFYYLLWTIMDGEGKPELAELHRQRVRELARNFRYFFAGDGSTPCFGRSMIYRFGYLAPLALGQYLNCLDVPAGQIKTACNAGIKFFAEEPILTHQNHLSMGYLRPCEAILEHYSCGGSPLWAAKAFSLLLLPEDDAFWRAVEEPLPIHEGAFSQPVNSAGLLLVGEGRTGHVQLINHKSHHDKPEYNAKYTKFAYSSIFSYEARPVYDSFNCDNVLQFSADGILFRQRWEMEHLYCARDFNASRYPLYQVDEAGRATTYTLIKDDFMVNVHLVEPTQALHFREGGYPLGFDEGEPEVVSAPGAEVAYKDGKLTFIRNLHGYTGQEPAAPYAEDVNGTNVRYHRSVVPQLTFENGDERRFILASQVYGKVGREGLEQLTSLVTDFAVEDDRVTMAFYDGERAFMQLGEVEEVRVTLNGRTLSGPIVLARVGKGGDLILLLEDGSPAAPTGGAGDG